MLKALLFVYKELTNFWHTVGTHIVLKSQHFVREICYVVLYCFIHKS